MLDDFIFADLEGSGLLVFMKLITLIVRLGSFPVNLLLFFAIPPIDRAVYPPQLQPVSGRNQDKITDAEVHVPITAVYFRCTGMQYFHMIEGAFGTLLLVPHIRPLFASR